MIASVLFATPMASAGPEAAAGADGFSALMAMATGTKTVAPAASLLEDATVPQEYVTEDNAQDPALLALAMAPWLTPPVAPPTAPVVEAPVVDGGAHPPVLTGGKAKPALFLGAATTSTLSTPVTLGSTPTTLEGPTTPEASLTQPAPIEGDGAATPTPIGTPIALPKAPTPANDVGTKQLLSKLPASAPAKAAEPSTGVLKTAPRMDTPTLPKAPVVAPQAKPAMGVSKPVAPQVQVPDAPTVPVANTQTVTQPASTAQASVRLASQAATALAAPQAAATPSPTATRLAPKLARVVPLTTKTANTATPIEPNTPPTLEARVEPKDLDDFRRAFAEPKPEPTITVTTLQQEKPVAKEAAPHAPAATAPPAARFEELDPTRLVRNEAFVRASSVMSLRRGATGEVRSPELGLVSVSAVPYAHGRIEVQVDAARPTTGALLVEHRAALVETVREVAGGANVHVGQHGMGAGGQKQSSKQPFDQTEMEPPVKLAIGGRRSRFVL
ncbi:MAG: hypothetical protein JNL79_08270 [Myxococcales bacterium]|nr:hypothetical protein [Myxococcales bacterium]